MNKKNWLIILIVVLISFVIWSYQNNEESVSLNPDEIFKIDTHCLVRCEFARSDCEWAALVKKMACRNLVDDIYSICRDSCRPEDYEENPLRRTTRKDCVEGCKLLFKNLREFCMKELEKNKKSCDEDYENCKDDCPPITQR